MGRSFRPLVQLRVLALGASEVDFCPLSLGYNFRYPPGRKHKIKDETGLIFTSTKYTVILAVSARNMNRRISQDDLN